MAELSSCNSRFLIFLIPYIQHHKFSVLIQVDMKTTVDVAGDLISICLSVCLCDTTLLTQCSVPCLSGDEFIGQGHWSLCREVTGQGHWSLCQEVMWSRSLVFVSGGDGQGHRSLCQEVTCYAIVNMCNRKLSSVASDENYDPAKSQYNAVKDAGWSESSKYVHCSLCVLVCLSVCHARHTSFIIHDFSGNASNLAIFAFISFLNVSTLAVSYSMCSGLAVLDIRQL